MILALVGIAFIAIFVIVGLSKGITRSIIGIFTSSIVCFLVAAVVAFIVPNVLAGNAFVDEAIFDINDTLAGIEMIPAALTDVMLELDIMADVIGAINYSIADLLIVVVALPFIYLVISFVFWLLKCIFVSIFRGIRPKTMDYLFGAILWGAIGAGIAFGIWFAAGSLQEMLEPIADLYADLFDFLPDFLTDLLFPDILPAVI